MNIDNKPHAPQTQEKIMRTDSNVALVYASIKPQIYQKYGMTWVSA
jgi:hypothetical protein